MPFKVKVKSMTVVKSLSKIISKKPQVRIDNLGPGNILNTQIIKKVKKLHFLKAFKRSLCTMRI